MIGILARKFFYACLSLVAVSMLTFVLVRTIPGDPFQQEQAIPDEIYQALRHTHGLDAPMHLQYFNYIRNLCALELGPSLIYHKQDVSEIIGYSFPTSALLGGEALALAIPIGLFFGLWSAFYQYGWQSSLTQILAIIGISDSQLYLRDTPPILFSSQTPSLSYCLLGNVQSNNFARHFACSTSCSLYCSHHQS